MKLPESIRQLLENYCGIDYQVTGDAALSSLLNFRRLQANVPSDDAYFRLLQTDTTELKAFVDGLLVPETWFFRDTNPFKYLRSFAKQFDQNSTFLRILSVPCATGEEPYSIAITLLDLGWLPKNFSIDAIDLSPNFLDIAKKGIYSLKSFRPQDPLDQSKYFDQIDERHFSLKSPIRTSVNFKQGNIIDPFFLNHASPYHVIFARNLLIYFSQNARKKTLDNIDRLLLPDGLLFLGHADNISFLSNKFARSAHPSAFAFKKLSQPAQKTHHIKLRSHEHHQNPASSSLKFLEQARDCAQKGLFYQAKEYSNRHIRAHGPSAEAYFLMGQIFASQGKFASAEEAYKKSIYLDSNNLDAISQLELLCIKKGDFHQAKILRNRSIRLKNSD